MRLFALLPLTLGATPAAAHVGHIAEVAGHSHWIGLGAIALAGALAWAGRKGKGEPEDTAEEAPEDETEEVRA